MNELITILIILAAIISFLNKIFGQKKKQQTTRQQSVPRSKPPEWIPPWLEPDELESPVQVSQEDDLDVIEEVEVLTASVPEHDLKSDVIRVPTSTERISKPIKSKRDVHDYQTVQKELEALDINLSTREELRKGIVLAEILGPCRARRNLRKIK